MNHVPPVEYGNLYRFVASLGVIAVAASVVLPWLFITSLDVLAVSQEELDGLTVVAREVVELRQRGVAIGQIFVVAAALLLLLAGITALWWSISHWASRQRVEDARDDMELLRARGEFEAADQSDVDAKHATDAEELTGESPAPEPAVSDPSTGGRPVHPADERPDPSSRGALAIREIEGRLFALLQTAYEPPFAVSANVKSRSTPGSDILDFLVDPIVEGPWGPIGIDLKVVNHQANVVNALREAMLRLATVTARFAVRSVYTGLTGEPPIAKCAGAVVLILGGEGVQLDRMRTRVRQTVYPINDALSRPVGVIAVSRHVFDELTADKFRSMLSAAIETGEVVTAL